MINAANFAKKGYINEIKTNSVKKFENEIVKSKNEIYYITKGDANEKADALIINEDMILGNVKMKIPYLGLPTVWLHEMLN